MNRAKQAAAPLSLHALIILWLFTATSLLAQQLPALNWEPRSDWLNVRTDVVPRAEGDGIADDTAAIQTALSQVSEQTGKPATVYLPPGTYRITRTLELKQKDGVAVIGCGRLTTIIWAGPSGQGDDARMFWSNGSPRSRYVGITWDGQGKACVGFDHDSKGYFETEIDHQHEAFFNFTASGIRIGHDQNTPGAQATAETTYVNCLFVNCESGLTLMQFNDYNHTLAGCEFRDCGIGVNSTGGANFYVRDSHFEKSRVMDIRARGEHGISIRRCTSTGSRMFLEEATIAPLTIQDCQVSAWTNPIGAMSLGSGPVILFDCVFANPPTSHPPITVSGGQHLVLSNNQSAGTDGLVKPGASQNITEVFAGRLGTNLTSPTQTFFQDTARIPGKVFDAKRNFGAKGDGQTDDFAAAQATLDAARAYGKGAVAYFPSGTYPVSATLKVRGGDYYLGGCGVHAQLRGKDLRGLPVLQIDEPRHIVVDNVAVYGGGGESSVDILQTGSSESRVHYERVWVSGMYSKKPFVGGVQVRNLPKGAVITGLHVNGNQHFVDSSRATILMSTSFEGTIIVEGKEAVRDGMLGFLTRLATINTHGLDVRDSQNLVMSDYYVESADRMMDFSGNPGDPAGRVTIQMPKSHCAQNPVIRVQDFHGRIAVGPSMFYPGGIDPAIITQQGTHPCDFILMACQAYEITSKLEFAGSARSTWLENTGRGMGENSLPDGALDRVAEALDDLRRLGAMDLALNDLVRSMMIENPPFLGQPINNPHQTGGMGENAARRFLASQEPSSEASPANVTTVHPQEIEDPLVNPYCGWGIWAGPRFYDSRQFSVDYNTTGFGDDAPLFSWVLIDWMWADLEPKEGQFDWKDLDTVVSYWKARNKQLVVRLWVTTDPGWAGAPGNKSCPDWLWDAGVKYHEYKAEGGVKQRCPAYADPTWETLYLPRMKRFLSAYRERYHKPGGPVVLDYVMGFGDWGEWHNMWSHYPWPSREKKWEVLGKAIGAYLDVFAPGQPEAQPVRNLAIAHVYDDDCGGDLPLAEAMQRQALDIAAARGFAFARNGFIDGLGGWPNDLMKKYWPDHQLIGEGDWSYEQMKKDKTHGSIAEHVDAFAKFHSTYAHLYMHAASYGQAMAEDRGEHERALKAGGIGYRFVLTSASWESSRRPGQTLTLQQEWVNRNASWCVYPYRLKLELLDANGKTAWSGIDAAFDPRSWLGGSRYSISSRFELAKDLKPGTYELRVALVDGDGKPSVRLAVSGVDALLRYRLGMLEIQ